MRTRRVLFALLITSLLISGCVRTTDREGLLQLYEYANYTSFPVVYYVGSNEKYDYFRWFEHQYRALHGEIEIDAKMPRSDDPAGFLYLRSDGSVGTRKFPPSD